jgi:hypothetical protein
VSFLTNIFRKLFDVILLPFAGLPWWVGASVLGVLIGVGMLWVFKKTSNQDRIERTKAKIHAGIFEMRLFNDDIAALFRAQGDILTANLAYFGLMLVPLIWIGPPLVLAMGQWNHHYGYHGFRPGDETLVEVELAPEWRKQFADVDEDDRPPVSLEVPAGVSVETPMAWFPSRNTLVWRVRTDDPGRHELAVKMGGESYTKEFDATDRVMRRSPVRHAGGFSDEFWTPGEAPLPHGAPVIRIQTGTPRNGFTADIANRVWFIFLISLIAGFAFKDRMGVKI